MPVSFDQFAAAVVAGCLAPDEELRAVVEQLEAAGKKDVQELARTLVLDKKLTKYQAQQIYLGKAKGLSFGQYVVLEPLGQGGMGEVFKARHRVMQRVVALKVLSPTAMKSPDAVQRFHREVRAAARLTHPHIVTAFDADQAGGTHYLVMECVDGQDLESLCRQHGRLPVPEAINYTLQAAEGLAYAHAQGVIHRDIKPHNLLLDKNGTLKILDMGLARLVDGTDMASVEGLTQSGIVMGTVDYMSPEQAEDTHRVDARADIYSLGCTLYRLLAGRTPYAGDTVVAKLMGHANKPVPALRDERGDVSQELSDVVRRMMAKQADDRYQTIDELTADLKACAAGLKPVTASSAAAMFAGDDQLTDFLAGLSHPAPASSTLANVPATAETRRPAPRRSAASVAAAPSVSLGEKIRNAQATHPVLWYGGLGGAAMIAGVLIVALWGGGDVEPTTVVTNPRPATTANKPSTPAAPRVESPKPTKQAKPRKPTPPPAAETEAALRSLAERVRASSGDPAPLIEELRTILQNHSGSSAAIRASELHTQLLARSPSTLDKLKSTPPADALQYLKAVLGKPVPPELIGVVGDLRGRQFGSILAVAASRDGKWLASAGSFGQVYLWDAQTLRLERVLSMRRIPLKAVAFAPSGKQLAVASDDFKVYLWDLTSDASPRVCEAHKSSVTSLTYTDDGQAIVSAGGADGTLRIWDPQTGTAVRWFPNHNEHVHGVAAVPGGSDVASLGESGRALCWRAGTGMISTDMKHPGAYALAVSPDGRTLLTGGVEGQMVRWDLESGKELDRSPAQGATIRRLAFLSAERAATCSDDGILRIWDVKTWQPLHMAGGHVGQVHGMCVLPNQGLLATSADDGVVRRWNAETLMEHDPPTGHVGPITNVTFTTSDQVILTRGQDRTLRTWHLNPMPAREAFKLEDVNVLERDNFLALYRNGRVLAYNVQSNFVRLDQFTAPVIEKGPQLEVAGSVTALAWSPVRRQLAVAVLEVSRTGIVQMWSPEENGPRRTNSFGREAGAISSLCFSPDGQRLALARASGTLATWDLVEDKILQEQKGSLPVSSTTPCLVQYSPDGTLLGFTEPGFVRLLHADSLQPIYERDQGASNVTANSAAFTPDGQYFICGGGYLMNGWVHCVSVREAEEVHYLDVPSPGSSVDVASDGRHFAAADGNGAVYVFRLNKTDR